MNRYAQLINLILFHNWTVCSRLRESGAHAFIGGKGASEKDEGGCRLEGEAPEGLHSIRKTLKGFLRRKC